MAIAFDSIAGSANNGTIQTQLVTTLTIPTNNPILFVASWFWGGSGATASGTCGSTPLTAGTRRNVALAGSGNFQDIQLLYLVAPPTGSQTITINYDQSSFVWAVAFAYTGAHQTANIENGQDGGSYGVGGNPAPVPNFSQQATVTLGNFLVGMAFTVDTSGYTGTITGGTNTTQRLTPQTFAVADSTTTVGTGSQSLFYNVTPDKDWGAITYSIIPAAEGPPPVSTPVSSNVYLDIVL